MPEQLTCGACGFANEPERVYCHNCGAKLDRSLLPVVESDKEGESAEAARRRIRKMTNPGGLTPGKLIKSLVTVLFWAALIASINLAIRPPAGLPEKTNELAARLVQSDLMEATQSPSPRTISFSEADVNGALKQALRRAGNGGASSTAFQSAYANLRPGVIHIGAEHVLGGFSIFSGVDYSLAVTDGKFTPTVVGGNIGRLPVHPEAVKLLDFAFQKLWTSLKREHEQMSRMQSVTIGRGTIIFVTKGAGAR